MEKQKKSIGIRTKLIGTIIPVVLVLIVSFFALARNAIIELSMGDLEANSKVYAENISGWTGDIFSELRVYKYTIENAGFADDEAILKYLQTTNGKYDDYPSGLYMGDDGGVYLDGSGWVPGDDWILTERDWYVDGKDNDDFAFGEPYYDSQTGDVCVSASVRMNYSKAVRVLAVDVYLDHLSELVATMLEDEIDIAFFVTKDSQTILAHEDTTMMDVKLDAKDIDSLYGNISKAISEGQIEGSLSVSGDNDDYYVNINPIANTQWYLVTGMSESEVMSELTQVEIIMSVIAAVAAVVLIILCIKLMNAIVNPVKKVSDVLTNVASGDFTKKIEVKGKDEIAIMSRSMQEFLDNMHGTLIEISGIASRLSTQSDENENVSQILKVSSDRQSEAVAKLNNMVDNLSADASRVASEISLLSSTIATAENEASIATDMMNMTVTASENGKIAMERVSEGMNSIEVAIKNLATQILKADEVTKSIGDMVHMIKDIAEETNLLSLNASIEAARAGEAGRGFAVVAEQISKLAANSKTAADNIEQLTTEISQAMSTASVQMEQSVSEVADNAIVVSKTSEAFTVVFDNVAKTNDAITHMEELVGEIDKVAGEMNKIIDVQLETTNMMAVSAHDINEHTKTVVDNSGTVAENAYKLDEESNNLTEKIKQFKV